MQILINTLFYFRLQRFEKTNEMLLNCNALSMGRIKEAAEDYRKHRLLLVDMKKDLSHIFTKIRTIKGKLAVKYPEAFDKVKKEAHKLDEGEEPEEEIAEEVIPKTVDLKTVEIESSVNYVPMDRKEDITDSSSS